MHRSHVSSGLVVGSFSALMLASAAQAGAVSNISQDRSVSADVFFDLNTPTQESDSKSAPDNGPFNETAVSGVASLGEGRASQNSSFGETNGVWNVSADLTAGYSPDAGIARGTSIFDVVFTLDAPRTVTINASGSFVNNLETGSVESAYSFSLSKSGQNLVQFHSPTSNPDEGDTLSDSISETLTIPAGSYQLLGSVVARGSRFDGSDPNVLNSLSFTFTSTEVIEPPPTVIPLPAAVWQTGVMLLGMGAIALRKRFHAKAC